jgi:hypothetical protein
VIRKTRCPVSASIHDFGGSFPESGAEAASSAQAAAGRARIRANAAQIPNGLILKRDLSAFMGYRGTYSLTQAEAASCAYYTTSTRNTATRLAPLRSAPAPAINDDTPGRKIRRGCVLWRASASSVDACRL